MKTLNRFGFLVSLAFVALLDGIRGRKLAINVALTPTESSHGSESLMPDAVIAFSFAVVKTGSTDRNFAAVSAQADIPRGVVLNDVVSVGDVGVTKKNVALFGLWPETLPVVASGSGGAIASLDLLVCDPTAPGKVMKMPATSGQTYIVIGRSRFANAAPASGDPLSLIHNVPRAVTNP